MPTPKRIYISGMISNLPEHIYRDKFECAEQFLLGEGWDVVNPLKINHAGHDGSWESCMTRDIEALFYCDAIYMLDNWGASRGARIERAIAFEMGKEIYYEGWYKKREVVVTKQERSYRWES